MFVKFAADTVGWGLSRCCPCHGAVLVMLVGRWWWGWGILGMAGSSTSTWSEVSSSPASWVRGGMQAGHRVTGVTQYPRWSCAAQTGSSSSSWPPWRGWFGEWGGVVIDGGPGWSIRSPHRNLEQQLFYWPNFLGKYASESSQASVWSLVAVLKLGKCNWTGEATTNYEQIRQSWDVKRSMSLTWVKLARVS